MSRLTPNEVTDLIEAYSAVYAPQELTEEQIWEEVENWVNSLVEEGYDLSEYTWEEMYESYLSEMGQRMTTGQMTAPKAAPTPTSRPQVAGGGMGGRRGGGSSPGGIKPSFQSTGGFGRYAPPSQQVRTPAPARPAQSAPARTAPARPAAPAPAARPAASAAPAAPKVTPKPAATPAPAGGSALDRATAAASKPTAFSPKPQSDVGAMIARSQARQAAQTPKPSTPTPAAKPTPRQARLNMEMEYDTFDAILEHLVAEGYADTEEAALKIMANMSEEWRVSIVEAQEARNNPEKYEDEQRKKKSKKQRAMDDPHTGINSPAFAAFMKQQGR